MAITQIRGAQVLDLTIDTADLASDSVTEAKLNTSVAGVGLTGGGGSALAVDLDEVSEVAVAVATDSFALLDASDNGDTKKEAIADLITAIAGNALTATSGVLDVLVDSAEIAAGAVDVDHLSDLRVTEGTALVADVAAGTIRVDDGATVAVISVSATTSTVTDDDETFIEVDSAGTVSNNTTGFTQGRIPLARVTAAAGDITVVVDSRAWLDIDPGADTGIVDADIVENETPTGDLDGADTTYTLTASPSPASSLKVYLNGIRQKAGGEDFTLATSVITWVAAPVATDVILADFRK